MKIEELLEQIKNMVNSTINADSPKEQIDMASDICSKIDEVATSHNETVSELHDMKDAYIKSIRKQGSKEEARDPIEPEKPKTLEEIVTGLQKKD